MPIKTWGKDDSDAVDHFVGRVLEIIEVDERRNHSDTMDYSDWRDTPCTYALVWLGTHGVPASTFGGLPLADMNPPPPWSEPRELAYWEQFAWVDCTNLFVWRGCEQRLPEVDAVMGQSGEPLMWANYMAWRAWEAARLEEANRKRAEAKAAADAEAAEAARRKAERARKASLKAEATRAAAEEKLAAAPKKGATLTVGGVTGKVCWVGVSKYRNKYSARFGLKDSRGNVTWHNVA